MSGGKSTTPRITTITLTTPWDRGLIPPPSIEFYNPGTGGMIKFYYQGEAH